MIEKKEEGGRERIREVGDRLRHIAKWEKYENGSKHKKQDPKNRKIEGNGGRIFRRNGMGV